MGRDPQVVVLVPCLDEASTVGLVVEAAKRALPACSVVVGDNNSSDGTADQAGRAGAVVLHITEPGKGWVMSRLLADIDADFYVMVDGDDTYDLSTLPQLLAEAEQGVDMVVGSRLTSGDGNEYRRGHRLGNRTLTWIFRQLFGLPLKDTLSGYRVMSRRFVKSFPVTAEGFEIETDLNVHAAFLRCAVREVDVGYSERPPGSLSKLSTYSDGWRILRRNAHLYKEARPRQAFGVLALPWILAASVLVGLPVLEFLDTGVVLHFPSLIAGVGCFIVGALLIQTGLVVARTASVRREAIHLAFLSFPSPRKLSSR